MKNELPYIRLRGRLAPAIFHVLSPVDIDVLTRGFFSPGVEFVFIHVVD